MSQENVEVVKATFEAWNADDMATYRELLDSEVTMILPPNWPERGPFLGREAVLAQYLRIDVPCIYTVRRGKVVGFEFLWEHAELARPDHPPPRLGSSRERRAR